MAVRLLRPSPLPRRLKVRVRHRLLWDLPHLPRQTPPLRGRRCLRRPSAAPPDLPGLSRCRQSPVARGWRSLQQRACRDRTPSTAQVPAASALVTAAEVLVRSLWRGHSKTGPSHFGPSRCSVVCRLHFAALSPVWLTAPGHPYAAVCC